MVRQELQNLQDLIKDVIRQRNEAIQACVPNDLKPYKVRKPRNQEEIEKLKAEYGDMLFVRRVKVDEKCSCGEGYTALPSPNCEQCAGTGTIPNGDVKCPHCTKCGVGKKSSVKRLPPPEGDGRWYCWHCGWKDTRAAEFGEVLVEGKPTKAKIERAIKLLHDEAVANGTYVCQYCNGTKRVQVTKICPCTKRAKYSQSCPKCGGSGQFKGFDDRYCLRQPFNMNSIDQLRNYAIARGHKLPRTMGRDGLQQLWQMTGDQVYKIASECKVFDQIAGFGTSLGISAIGDDIVRVHTQFMFTSADGRITSKNPNISAAPPPEKYPEIAAAWHKCIAWKPSDTTTLVRVVFDNIHYWTFGIEARDETWLGALQYGSLEWWLLTTAQIKTEPEKVGEQADEMYSTTQYAMAREILFGFMRERSANSIHQRNRHLFSGVGIIEHLLNLLVRQFPRAVEFKGMIARQAHKQKFLMSKFGYRRDFYNVMRSDRDGNYHGTTDLSHAVSFLPSNHAYCTMALALRGSAPGMHLVNVYDDGFLFEINNGWLPNLNDISNAISKCAAAGILILPNSEIWIPGVSIEVME